MLLHVRGCRHSLLMMTQTLVLMLVRVALLETSLQSDPILVPFEVPTDVVNALEVVHVALP